jgi:pilus assembly protein CpaC
MHRSNHVPHTTFWKHMLSWGLVALLGIGSAMAQERVAPPTPAPTEPGARPSTLLVPIGGTRPLQMKGKKIITRAENVNERVLEVRPVRDQLDTVLLLGKEAGTTRLTLTAQDGTTETYEVIVQLDVEYLKSILQRAVPTANLSLIPIHSSTVIISGTVNHLEDIEVIIRTANAVLGAGGPGADRVINMLKVAGVQQVQLDAVIAFVDRTLSRQMGVDWFQAGAHHSLASTVSGFLVPGSIVTSVGTSASGQIVAGSPNLTLSLLNSEEALDVAMKALKSESITKIMSQPSVTTLSGKSATLLSGGQQAIPQSGGLGTTTVTFQDFGTTLDILPIVLGTGKIRLEVQPEVSQLSNQGAVQANGVTVQGRITQRCHTTVELEPGQTLVIGGLIQNAVLGTTTMVPVLGEIPFLGTIFSFKSFQEDEQELVILITPHLVDPQSCDQLAKLLPGQESRSPDDFELFLEQIMEAPRGPREVCPNNHYVPAWKNGPTAQIFPCAEDGVPRCVGLRCGGRGLVDNGNIGYHAEGLPGPEKAAVPVGHGADLLPPTDVAETPGAPIGTPTPGKPAALPSVFAPTGANGPR